MTPFPRVVVAGGAMQRGEQYGRRARERVHASLRLYRKVFAANANVTWEEARAKAASYVPALEAYDARYLDELRGIASGAGVDALDVLALNVRTEILIPAAAVEGRAIPPECTSIAATREATASGTILVGQNWDYLADAAGTVILLEVHPDDGLPFITFVEAGLLAKIGMNAAGIAVLTNGLATRLDAEADGIPYHVLLRRMLACTSLAEATAELQRVPRASTANYLIASAEGAVVDVEAWASGAGTTCQLIAPRNGLLVHTNHCIAVPSDRRDAPLHLTDTSAPRRARAEELLRRQGGKVGIEDVKRALSDHTGHPLGVCTHLDLDVPELERYPTVASLIMEPETRRMLLAQGNPCRATWQELDVTALAGSA